MKILKENRHGADIASRALVLESGFGVRGSAPLSLTLETTSRSGEVTRIGISLTPSEFAAVVAAGWKLLDGAE